MSGNIVSEFIILKSKLHTVKMYKYNFFKLTEPQIKNITSPLPKNAICKAKFRFKQKNIIFKMHTVFSMR